MSMILRGSGDFTGAPAQVHKNPCAATVTCAPVDFLGTGAPAQIPVASTLSNFSNMCRRVIGLGTISP
jgi:hypothetical protein